MSINVNDNLKARQQITLKHRPASMTHTELSTFMVLRFYIVFAGTCCFPATRVLVIAAEAVN